MSLSIGSRLGNYEVLSLLGKGGMGEVFRARDTQLQRDVALKLLPDVFASDPERLSRFQREAQALASLNHPNIAHIYGLEGTDESRCIVMELVDGETLEKRLKRGPIPVDETLPIAAHICEALGAAHEKGIIHRDLKPANVKITTDGTVKVLDFGLAKMRETSSSEGAQALSNSPTLMSASTPGVILGTAAYMSPEQAKGREVDRRTDIFAFGCVLFEMLTGRPAFRGETVTEILGAVMHAEPDWSALPQATPVAIRSLLRRCLRKDAQQRPKDAGDLRIEIEELRAAVSAADPTVIAQGPATAPRRWLLLFALACLAIAALTGIAVWQLRTVPASLNRPVERVAIPLPPDTTLVRSRNTELVALSPDGTHLVYVAAKSGAAGQLYLRAMDTLEASPIAGTDGAASPFFSPDGQWIGFFTASALKKIPISGGAALTLCNIPGGFGGGTWGPDNIIVFASSLGSGLMQVSAAGGQPEPFTTLQQGEAGHRWPQFLPDGKGVLFSVGLGTNNPDDDHIAVQLLQSRERRILVRRGGTHGRYVPTGHLVYYRAGTIMAVPFDPVELELKGSAYPVVEDVLGNVGNAGVAQFSISNLGSLAYVPGGSLSAGATMVWVNRKGLAEPLAAPARTYRAPRLSPDGSRVAVGIGSDVWIYDILRETLTRLTFEGNNTGNAAIWTPDGKRIVFPSNRSGPDNLFWKAADGSGPEERLTTSPNPQRVGSFSADGRTMAYTDVDPKTGQDIWVLPMEGDRKPRVFLQTPFGESSALLSPNGRWMAYTSDESGRPEVYVRPFPGPGGKWQVSTEGGAEAAWSTKGTELFYRTGGQREKMMVVDIQNEPTFSAGKPRLLFEGPYVGNAGAGALYSVSPDGQRFLMTKTADQRQTALTQINVVLNWFEELKRRVPTGQ